ncbi:MAG: preprotein translocase subunit YajC [Porticoccaceae bacterium]|nr:preprotein translocase subunit YajC [Porticoccaceae bacterium]
MFGGLFLIMYFMLIRPQKKRQKEHLDLMGALNKGDEVVLTSGLIGKITGLSDDYLTVDTGTVELKFQRVAVHAVLPKGTIKSI